MELLQLYEKIDIAREELNAAYADRDFGKI